LICVALFGVAVLSWSPLNELLLIAADPNLAISAQLESTRFARLVHWQTLADAAWRSPWFGYGWNQVQIAHQATVLDHPYAGEVLSNSHNLVLDLLIWTGLPLGILITALLVWWGLRQIQSCRTGTQAALLAAVGAVFLHALFEYPLNYLFFLLPVGLLIGILEGLSSPSSTLVARKWTLAAPASMLLGLTAWVAVEYVEVEAAGRVMRFVAAGIGVHKVSEAPAPEVFLLDRPREFHRFALSRARPGMSAEEVDSALWSSRMAPFPPSLLREALILGLGLNGHPAEARSALERLCWTNKVKRCIEAQEAWAALQGQYPELRKIPPPKLPATRKPV
jgi:hypothetical protein